MRYHGFQEFIMNMLLFTFFSTSYLSCGQINKLSGTWISEKNEMILIQDTVKYENYLTNSRHITKNFYLEIKKDTLSFQTRYYSSKDGYKNLHVKKHSLRITELTDSTLVVDPVSDFSKEFFSTNQSVEFIKQNYIKNPSFDLKKLVFHASGCNGSCPRINMVITGDKKMVLNATFYKDSFGDKKDEEASGNFRGVLTDNVYNQLIRLLVQSRINTLDIRSQELCCDGVVKTIIVNYNDDKSSFIKTMHEPPFLKKLISFLYSIHKKTMLIRVEKAPLEK